MAILKAIWQFFVVIWKLIVRDYWVVKECGFPYPEGYATYNPWRKTILDTGLTKEEAEYHCRELNKEYL